MPGTTTQTRPAPLPQAPTGTPLYVHLPFCVTKCHYCDFYSLPAEGQDIPGFLESLLLEIDQRAPEAPRTVFFGGGTPSLLSVEQWRLLIARLDQRTGFRNSAVEISVECNPESLDEDKARALLDLGVTRLSIGLQSLRPQTLEQFGRVHSAQEALGAFRAARRAGCASINLDVIFANPGQTAEHWSEDLDRILAEQPDHLAAYNLTFEESTPFLRWLEQGKLQAAPEDLELELVDITRTKTRAAGLEAYEISNYGRPGHECLHNLNYWHNGTYVGLGPSAVSKIGLARGGSPRSVARYRRLLAEAGYALEWSETLSESARLAETWWLGLRLREGLSETEALERAGVQTPPDSIAPLLRRLTEEGLLEPHAGRYRLTDQGLPLADSVAAEFFRD
ncbi:MAG TPA: radical SAM family heme chaperone HemW [Planctomycetota bacterium]|nr:radical SAM family heme chaperone HemW [Planctomycetota bacterium]HPF12960.1 radical SAM family heme chaperone HemW [Planctomycetota bacterium]HRV79851.1 radical SAM family heme chaperone HemW [Planctomycetota bacterium]